MIIYHFHIHPQFIYESFHLHYIITSSVLNLLCSGLHHKKKDCNIEATVQKFQTVIDKNMNSFFPPSVNIQPGESTIISKFGPNGGWGDSRDHALCFQLMQKT